MKVLDAAFLESAASEVASDPKTVLAMNCCSRSGPTEVLTNREVAAKLQVLGGCGAQPTFSVKIPKEGKCTSQKSSGRCWLFALLNVCRLGVIKKYSLDSDFELSQAHLHFWDKIERANYFLENVLDTLAEPLEGRLMQYLLKNPMEDGGQWDMAISLVLKHGIVPKSAYPESATSQASRYMNRFVNNKLRQFASELRAAAENGASADKLREDAKPSMMKEIYRIVCVHLGTPPSTFDWSFYGNGEDGGDDDDDVPCKEDDKKKQIKKKKKKKKHFAFRSLTPQSFLRDHVDVDLKSHVSLINDPRNEYYKLYTVSRLGNVVGTANPVRYINLPISELRSAAQKRLDAGEPVWFGCDVGKQLHRSLGVMSLELLDYDLVFGTNPNGMDKATRLRYGESLMTHAMVLTGYDAADDASTISKWRVENSWGEKGDQKGYLTMTDSWFEEYMYQIAVPMEGLPEKVLGVLQQEDKVVVLPPWDPMGALA